MNAPIVRLFALFLVLFAVLVGFTSGLKMPSRSGLSATNLCCAPPS